MKNFKQIAFGAMICALAMGFSSFTSATKIAAGDVYANKDDSGTYNKLANPYTPADCASDTPVCAYFVTASGAPHVSGATLSASQISTDLSHGWISSEGTNGLYSGN